VAGLPRPLFMFAYGPSTGALLRRCGFQVLFQAGPDPLFLAYAEPGDHRAQQPEGALGRQPDQPLARRVLLAPDSRVGCRSLTGMIVMTQR